MQSWRPRTRSQYASRLRALAAYAERTGPSDPAAALAGLLAERAQTGGTASALRGIISAIRAVEDLQWLPLAVTPLHKRIAAGAASSGFQPYLSPAGMVHLLEGAKNSRYGTVFGALAILSFFALNGAFCGWPGRGERLLRAKLFQGGARARNQVQSRAEYRCTLLSSSALSQ